MWCIGTITGEYIANMEAILDLYAEPAVANEVRICYDERPCQLIDHVLTPIPAKPGVSQKEHQEYLRNGVCNVLLAYNLETGQRHIQVTDTKTKTDYAYFMHWVATELYPNQRIKLIQDNYGTHSYGAFYENLPVEDARKLRKQIDFYFTPKHGSWLNMAEIEFSALSRQCLNRRIASKELLEREVACWQEKRNLTSTKVNWSFTTDKAREKMKNRYDEINN